MRIWLASVALAYNSIKCEDGTIIALRVDKKACRNSPHSYHVRDGIKMGDGKIEDSMLWMDYGHIQQYHMGITAENVAEKFQITREAAR